MKWIKYFFICCFFGVALAHVAIADEVLLENGDKITGKLVRLEQGNLVLRTDYAGEITIKAEKVVQLTTVEPVVTTLEDGTTRKGTSFYRDTPSADTRREAETTANDINIADVKNIYPKPRPKVRISARANVGIINEKGNTDTDQYRLDAELIARTDKHRFTIGGEINNEKANSELTVANWKGYGIYDYFFKPKWFFNVNSLFENDEFADLDLRSTLGAGGGHQIFESDELNLYVSAGVAYINENFIVADDKEFPAAQWLIRYNQYFFNKFVQLFHTNNGFISFDDTSDWLINTRQGLRFPIYKGFVTTLQYNFEYNNDPSPDAPEKWDSSLVFLLGYQFKN